MKKALLLIIPALVVFGLTMFLIHEQKDAAWLLQLGMLIGVIGVGVSCVMEAVEMREYRMKEEEWEEDL